MNSVVGPADNGSDHLFEGFDLAVWLNHGIPLLGPLVRSGRMISRARARRLFFPIEERAFTYKRYDELLARLDAADVDVVPLRDLGRASASDRAVVALRHDVDESLESALELARLEHSRGLSATYFALHTARYWASAKLIPSLRRLQDDFGHEVGWHNDLVTLQCVHDVDAVAFLAHELERLRAAGLVVGGSAPHGSPWCYRLGFHNNYFFSELADQIVPGFPNNETVVTGRGPRTIPHVSMADFGLTYDAYHLDNDLYFSDTASVDGRRWHTDELDLSVLAPTHKAVILVHPCHWDGSVVAKVVRLGRYVATRRWREHAVA
jgi:hypothetical protein